MSDLSPEEQAAGCRLDLSLAIVKNYFQMKREDREQLRSLLIKMYGLVKEEWANTAFDEFLCKLGHEIGEYCISNPEEILYIEALKEN